FGLMFLSNPPTLPSICLHCVARCAMDETGTGSLSIFPGGATALLPRSPSSAGSTTTEMGAAPRSAGNPQHGLPLLDRPRAGVEAVLQIRKREIRMDMKVPEARAEAAPAPTVATPPQPEPPPEAPKPRAPVSDRIPSIIVAVIMAAVAALSIWYLVRPEPLLVQGEVDATRLDIAARVDGRVGEIPVDRGQNIDANAALVRIDNPETLAKHEQALAAKAVADPQLANINVGTRVEVIAARKAALERAEASVVLAQKTYERVRQLAEHGNAPQARLDQATDG